METSKNPVGIFSELITVIIYNTLLYFMCFSNNFTISNIPINIQASVFQFDIQIEQQVLNVYMHMVHLLYK